MASASSSEEIYLYPHPLTLARDRAEAERMRLADTTAYSDMCRTWGSLGGSPHSTATVPTTSGC